MNKSIDRERYGIARQLIIYKNLNILTQKFRKGLVLFFFSILSAPSLYKMTACTFLEKAVTFII